MYTLIDGVKRNEENPKTFHIPSKEEIGQLKKGDHVKLGFEEEGNCERMWVKIVDIVGEDHFVGMLDNQPLGLETIKLHDVVEFEANQIINIL